MLVKRSNAEFVPLYVTHGKDNRKRVRLNRFHAMLRNQSHLVSPKLFWWVNECHYTTRLVCDDTLELGKNLIFGPFCLFMPHTISFVWLFLCNRPPLSSICIALGRSCINRKLGPVPHSDMSSFLWVQSQTGLLNFPKDQGNYHCSYHHLPQCVLSRVQQPEKYCLCEWH